MEVRKLRNVVLIDEETYTCSIELYSKAEDKWTRTDYVSKKDDPSPVNQWILNQISTGKYKITK